MIFQNMDMHSQLRVGRRTSFLGGGISRPGRRRGGGGGGQGGGGGAGCFATKHDGNKAARVRMCRLIRSTTRPGCRPQGWSRPNVRATLSYLNGRTWWQ